MKKNLLKTVLMLVCLMACKHGEGPILYRPYPDTYIKASLNGVDWQSQYERYGWVMDAQAYEGPAPNLSCSDAYRLIRLRQISVEGSLRYEIGLQLYQFTPKRYSLTPRDALAKVDSCRPYAIFVTAESDALPGTLT